MSKILKMRQKRAEVWDKAKAFPASLAARPEGEPARQAAQLPSGSLGLHA